MTKNELIELLMNEVVKNGYIKASEIKDFNSFSDEIKNKIIIEVNIINSYQKITELAYNYLKNSSFKDKYNIFNISSFYSLSLVTSTLIKECIIDIESIK